MRLLLLAVALGAAWAVTCSADTPAQLLGQPHPIDVGGGEKALALVDINRDQHLDLVVGLQDEGALLVLAGDGSGGFKPIDRVQAGPNPTALAVSDFTDDQWPDAVVANHEVASLTVLLGARGKLELSSNSRLPVMVQPHPHYVLAADMDRDGNDDLLVDSRDGRSVLLIQGLGGGLFDLPGTPVAVGGQPYLGFSVGDVNGDGWLDLVTPNAAAVAVMLNSGSKKLSFAEPIMVEANAPFSVQLADFNADETLDLLTASDGTSVQLFAGDGKGGFGSATEPATAVPSGAKQIVIGDLNGDGFDDAVISSWGPNILILFGGTTPSWSRLRLSDVDTAWSAVLGDVDGDGLDDVIVADATNSTIVVYPSRTRQ